MKKILIVCKGHRNIAGAQLYLKHISTIFPKQDYLVYFLLHKGDGIRFIDEISLSCLTHIVEYDWRHLQFCRSFFLAKAIYGQIRPDLIIFNSSEDEILAPIWASLFFSRAKKVMIVHWALSENDLPLFPGRKIGFVPIPSRYAVKKRFFRSRAYKVLNHFVFVNDATRKAYIKLYGIKTSRCTTIYNGVDISKYSNAEARLKVRRNLNLDPSEIMVLATGNLTEVKGHKYLIDAIATLRRRGIEVKCFVAGQGQLLKPLLKQIDNLGLSDSIKLLGYRKDVADLLSASDLFCMPSINEAFGYSIIEAMAAGKPIVASDVGGIPEVVTQGKEGLLVKAGDTEALSNAIEQIILNKPLREVLSKNAQEKVKNSFSLERMQMHTKHLFEKVLQNHNSV